MYAMLETTVRKPAILRGAQKPQTEQKENVQLVTKSQAATAKNTKI